LILHWVIVLKQQYYLLIVGGVPSLILLCRLHAPREWPAEAYELLDGCLTLNPRQRLTAEQAQLLPFFGLRASDDEQQPLTSGTTLPSMTEVPTGVENASHRRSIKAVPRLDPSNGSTAMQH